VLDHHAAAQPRCQFLFFGVAGRRSPSADTITLPRTAHHRRDPDPLARLRRIPDRHDALMPPVIIIVLTAFKAASEVNAYPPTLFPQQWTLDNFAAIFQRLPFGRSS